MSYMIEIENLRNLKSAVSLWLEHKPMRQQKHFLGFPRQVLWITPHVEPNFV